MGAYAFFKQAVAGEPDSHSLQDLMLAYYSNETGVTTGSVSDRKFAFFLQKLGLSAATNKLSMKDLERQYLASLGFTSLAQYWASTPGAPAAPSTLYYDDSVFDSAVFA